MASTHAGNGTRTKRVVIVGAGETLHAQMMGLFLTGTLQAGLGSLPPKRQPPRIPAHV